MTDACLDAETLAAWADGGLTGAALDMAQAHVADCARCQALVGTLARIKAAAPPAESARSARWRLAWLVPVAAAATAVAVWVAVPQDHGPRPSQATEVQRQAGAAKPPEGPPVTARSVAAANEKEETPSAKKDAADANRPREQAQEPRRDIVQPEADRLKLQDEPSSSAAQPAGETASAAAPAAAPAAPSPASAAAAPAATAPAAGPPPAATQKALGLARSSAANAEVAGVDIVSPDPSVRWRIAGSSLLRSTNGGSRWEAASTGTTTALTAGSAPSASVCWVVGHGGVVLLSTDGQTWRRLAFPDTADLTAVRARNARAASVTTADGRPFSTTDGGATWAPRPLQEF